MILSKTCESPSDSRVSGDMADNKFISDTRSCSNPSTVAGVPVKYGRCVPVKYSVQETPNTVSLKGTGQGVNMSNQYNWMA